MKQDMIYDLSESVGAESSCIMLNFVELMAETSMHFTG